MSVGAWLDLDLLRQRREDLGQVKPQVQATGSLLKRGALLGSAVPIAVLLICGWFVIRERLLTGEVSALQPAVQEHGELQQRLTSTQAELKTLETQNRALAKALADVRSSSAFLSELQRIIPTSLELSSVVVNGDGLVLQGLAMPKGGLKAVNAFLLNLKQSSFLRAGSVTLVKAVFNNSKDNPQLDYELKASFAKDVYQVGVDRLTALGALGMARRVSLMQQQGLLP
ncbi:PilN domain-containing protein [Synechococcus sp. BS55D]|uniref:PilN domain-containing protein n=1 Tax=Synechococcus sp. BS55D TaxID=2055943 RepID=UPI00137596C9|nr:PilN domain-containing protein [Synechococcus sp. BS55D]